MGGGTGTARGGAAKGAAARGTGGTGRRRRGEDVAVGAAGARKGFLEFDPAL